MRTNHILVCISKGMASRLREVIVPLYLTLMGTCPEYCVWFGPPQSKRDIYKLKTV